MTNTTLTINPTVITTGESTMTTTLTMEQLKANMKAQAANELAKAQADLMTNPAFQQVMLNQAVKELTTEKLRSIETQIKAIPEMYPEAIKSGPKTGQLRKWRDAYLYNLGIDVQIVYNIIKGVQYSGATHKAIMKSVLPLSDSFIEDLASAFGQQAYFSLAEGTLNEEVPMDYVKVREMLMLLEAELGVKLNLDLFKESSVKLQWEASRNKAEVDYANYLKSLENKEAHFITA